ncbi:putative effector protein [Ceratobasidium theobromae]|uniref:Putative effector protein n=1 Tax=Ceratobasidium theobromae TaxID=1582974 RepID=A0A5N5QC33_9AGAM|nr:putative effector protein [Ceratobasidium theobromae]
MQFFTTRAAFIAALASLVAASPIAEVERTLTKRELSYGDPDLVTDQGNQFKLNFGSTEGHPNACPGHYICSDPVIGSDIPKNGDAHDDVSLGDPDDFVDEGDRWMWDTQRLNYGSTSGHPNACGGHYVCYIYK